MFWTSPGPDIRGCLDFKPISKSNQSFHSHISLTIPESSLTMSFESHKGRVSISGVVVLENGRVLNKAKSQYNHIFDGHIYLPITGGGSALASLRYFNPNDPLPTPYAYFITAQVSVSFMYSLMCLSLLCGFVGFRHASFSSQSCPGSQDYCTRHDDGRL